MDTLADVLRRRFADDGERPVLRGVTRLPSGALQALKAASRDADSVSQTSGTLTYGDLGAIAAAYANAFREYRRDGMALHVGILGENSADFVFSEAGAWLAGGTVVGLNTTRSPREVVRDAEHTDCSLIVGDPGHIESLDTTIPRLAFGTGLDAAVAARAGEPDPEAPLDDTTPGFLFFTSGTTGAPKAVIRSHRTILPATDRIASRLALTTNDTGLVNMPLFHAAANMMCLVPAVLRAASVVVAEKFSVSKFLPSIREHGVTFWAYTGTPLAYLVASPERPGDADSPLRIATGNEGNSELCDTFAARFGCDVIDVYGASEGGIGIVRRTGDPKGSLGMPPDGVIVVDDDDNECGPGVVGEIVNTKSLGSFEGYYKNPEAEASRHAGGWYRSGDLARRDADGFLYFAGRTGDWARVDGENLALAPIEALITEHPCVVVAAVVAVRASDAGDRLVAVVETKPGTDTSSLADAISVFVRAHPDAGTKWVPSEVKIVDSIPKLATHKLDRRAIRDMVDTLPNAPGATATP